MRSIVDRRSFALMLAASVPCLDRRLGGTAAAAGAPWLSDAFRDEVIAVGRRHFPNMPFTPGRGVVLSGGHTLYLNNVYANVEGLSAANREAAIVKWLSHFTPEADIKADAVKKATDSWQGARPLLRLRLMTLAMAKVAPQIVGESFSPTLRLVFTIDLGDKDLYVSDEKFARWKVSQAEVRAAAISNLEAMSKAVPISVTAPKDGRGRFAVIESGDGYDAARLALPGFRDRLRKAIGQDFIAAVPARDVMICWSLDLDDQEGLVQAVEAHQASAAHALTREMFLVAKDRMVPMQAAWAP